MAIKYEKNEKKIVSAPQPFKKAPSNVRKIASVNDIDDILPPFLEPQNVPEVCVIGRSNVGKSTLINSLLNFNDSYVQKCAVSDKPGETRRLDFYTVGVRKYQVKNNPDKDQDPQIVKIPAIILVDLPGYSFSFLPPDEVENLLNMTTSFLLGRGPTLKRVILVLDARHGFKFSDKKFFTQFNESIKTMRKSISEDEFKVTWKLQICLTKCDLVDRLDLARRIQDVEDSLGSWLPTSNYINASNLPILYVSGKDRKGIIQLQHELASLIPMHPDSVNKSDSSSVKKKKKQVILFSKLSPGTTENKPWSILKNDR